MKTATIQKESLQFLKDLSANNNRDWFQENKPRYTQAHENMINFADQLLALMQEHDKIETPTGKKSLLRIYRDVRFSKNKAPYKNNMSGGFRRATDYLRGGYYFHVQPGESFVGGGFWQPNSKDLAHIRAQLAQDPDPLRNIIQSTPFTDTFGQLEGEKVKTAPKGYAKDHPAIDLLRHKSFIVHRSFTDKEVLSPKFLGMVNDTFRNMRPFFDHMSEILTTDLNGVELEGLAG